MNKPVVLLLVLVSTVANSQVYKRVGPDGQVFFSDQPGPGAERIKVQPAQAISMPPVPETVLETDTGSTAGAQADDIVAYTSFSILSPMDDEAVRANNGFVTIYLSLQPGLAANNSVVLNIDGEDGKANVSSEELSIGLNNMSRGQHTIAARIVDARGATLIETQPVTFHVLRVAAGG